MSQGSSQPKPQVPMKRTTMTWKDLVLGISVATVLILGMAALAWLERKKTPIFTEYEKEASNTFTPSDPSTPIVIFGLNSDITYEVLKWVRPGIQCKRGTLPVPYGETAENLTSLPEISANTCTIEKPTTGDEIIDWAGLKGLYGVFVDDPEFPSLKGRLLYFKKNPVEEIPLNALISGLSSKYNQTPNTRKNLVFGAVPIQMIEFPLKASGEDFRIRIMASDYNGKESGDYVLSVFLDNLTVINSILDASKAKAENAAHQKVEQLLK